MAGKECSKPKWSNFTLHARNAIQRGITKQYPKPGMWERFQDWNPLAQELRPLIHSFVKNLLVQIPLPDKPKVEIEGSVSWDIMLICFECEFSDVVKPIFFTDHLDPWYAAGHFPCGWDGKIFPSNWAGVIPEGKLKVF